jgi:uroporphyrin-III C-methyltransferase/precorrin-2 dehydrogenase/sirohydrochlorin ferrochelatase
MPFCNCFSDYNSKEGEFRSMSYFPFFVDLKGKQGLIVGGGTIAYHKICKLLPYESNLTVVAPDFNSDILTLKDIYDQSDNDAGLTLEMRKFKDSDVDGNLFVIAATSDKPLNAHIYDMCSEKGILVNVVDDKERCGFMFPSLVKKGKLSIGISTEGASPRIATVYRRKLESEIPDEIEQILLYLDSIRPAVKTAIGDEKTRAALFSEIADWCLSNLTIPDDEWFQTLLSKYSF